MTTEAGVDVVAVGEVMGLLDPDEDGPLEDAAHLSLRVAGAEANVLIVLARLGRSAALVSAVGNDPVGRLILRTLTEQGVDVGHVHVDETARTGIFFKERFEDGLRRVYYYRDGSAASQLPAAVAAVHLVPTPQVLVLSGLSLGLGAPGGLASVAREAIRHFKASGATVVFDPNLRPRLWEGSQAAEDFAEISKEVDILVAGRDELPELVPGRSAEHAARELCANGMRAVVVKNGPHGAVLVEGSGRTEIPPFPVEQVVDPVGAGDAFAAGVVCGLLQSWPLADSARLGAMLGACAVTGSGDWEAVPTGEPPRQLLQRYVTSVGLVGGRT